jgi:hypothetical protein
MGWLDGFEVVEKKVSKKSQAKTFEEIVDDTFETQIRIANGETIHTTKKKSDGSYGITPSWMKDGVVYPKVGIYPLLGGSGIKMGESQYKQWLVDTKQNWRNDKDLKKILNEVESKMKKAADSRRKSLQNK